MEFDGHKLANRSGEIYF